MSPNSCFLSGLSATQRLGVQLLAFVAAFWSALATQAQPVFPAEPQSAEPESKEKAPAKEAGGAKELGDEWVRVTKDEQGEPKAMQVAIVTYRGKVDDRPVVVDLIGAVHVGDASYYDQLNRRFPRYDALLYELVAPKGTVIQPGEKANSRSPMGAVQGGMQSVLELEHQLEKIDYTKPNFVHADMSPDEFFKSMEERDEGVLQMFFRMMGQGIAMQGKQAAKGESSDLDIMRAMFAPDRARRLKIVFAEQMTLMGDALGNFGGAQGSTIITERNKAALKVLRKELDAGKSHVGVFYGAGHMSDIDDRLRDEFKLLPEAIIWLDAWDLTAKAP